MSNVDVSVLRDVTNRIFDVIERDLKMRSVELSCDFCQSISDEELYEVGWEPQDFTVGSLATAIPIMLMHIAPLLKWLSRAVPSYVPPPERKT